MHVTLVGLTGGIGAGKTAVARRLAAHGAVIIDADQLAREVAAPGTDGLRAIIEAFGDQVIGPDGGLDRPAMSRIVFADPDRRKALEAIVHPRVRARTRELIDAAPPGAIVVNDVPLLVEAGLTSGYDMIIVVEAPEETRVARLRADRGMPADEARSRIRSQATDVQRRAHADILIVNDGTREHLMAQVDAAWRQIRAGRP